ncbi:MAG: hypothetical protein ACFB11_00735 [Paracoccaceae bacterium]
MSIKVQAFTSSTAAKPSATISLGESRSQQYIRIGMTASAQIEAFGHQLDAEKHGLAITVSDEPKSNHQIDIKLVPVSDPDAVPLKNSMHGSCFVKLVPWSKVAAGKRPAEHMKLLTKSANSISVRLPEWARPELKKVGQGKSIMDM